MNAVHRMESGNPGQWIQELSQRGQLRWQHGGNNYGLLVPVLLELNGWQGDILSLVDALPCNVRELHLQDVLAIMAALGYRIHSERTSLQNLKAEDLPGLFIFADKARQSQAIVIRERSAYGMIWADGREQHRGDLPEGDGTFYRFLRINLDDETENKTTWLPELGERFRPLIGYAATLSLVMHLFTLAMPLFSMAVYDRVISAHAPETLPLLAVGVVMALSVEHLIRWMRVRLAGWIGARSGVIATAAMFERLLFLPASIIEQASISSQLARIRAFESIRDFITGPVFLTILEIPFLLVLIGVIALLAGPVATISLAIIGLQLVMLLTLRSRWKRLGRNSAHASAERQQILMDTIEHSKAIYAAGLSERMLQRFKSVSWQTAKAQYRFSLNAAVVQHMAGLVTVIAGVATISWSLTRIWDQEMTGGAMVATMIITWRVLYPLQALCGVMPQLEQIIAALKQVGQLMAFTPESHAANLVLAEHQLNGNVSFQNLGLRYGRKSDPVFMGLNGDIASGEIVAIFGGNGTGKSSILRLLLGLYAPAMGGIRLDGVDHRQFDPRSLRRQMNYLPQLPELLPGTIAENLRVHDPLADDYRLRQALLWADAWEMIEQLPAGMDTKLGEHAFIPSSGLAMRICLARMYLTDRKLVLCDELSSQLLNSSTGERFKQFLKESRGKRTVIFVTHREDWLPLADVVIYLQPNQRPVMSRPEKLMENAA